MAATHFVNFSFPLVAILDIIIAKIDDLVLNLTKSQVVVVVELSFSSVVKAEANMQIYYIL